MRRLTALLTVAAAAAASGVAHGAPAPPSGSAPAQARTVSCVPGAATFEGDMARTRGAALLQMRFTLQARTPQARRWLPVTVPGWAGWAAASPGRQRFVFTRTVRDLVAPARYRAVVRFRWRDAAGRTLLRARRLARACRQGVARPDLSPLRARVVAAGATGARYEIAYRNEGDAPAPRFGVTLTVGGQRVETVAPGLAGGRRGILTLDGPACGPDGALELVLDRAGEVVEHDETDNRLSAACSGA